LLEWERGYFLLFSSRVNSSFLCARFHRHPLEPAFAGSGRPQVCIPQFVVALNLRELFPANSRRRRTTVMVILGGADLSAQLSGLGKADRGG
jgi:hypothetical protein